MNYTNQPIRRQDHLLNEEQALDLLRNGEYGVLSMQAEEGGAYGVPINYVWDGKDCLYLHGAPEGRKLRCMALCNRVSFCVVGKTQVIAEEFTTRYESIVLKCRASTRLEDEEKIQALSLLLKKYAPAHHEAGMKAAERSFPRTEIIRLEILEMSGKCK